MSARQVFEWIKEGFRFEAVQISRRAFLVRSEAEDGSVVTETVVRKLPAEASPVSGTRAEAIRKGLSPPAADNRIDTAPLSIRPGGRVR